MFLDASRVDFAREPTAIQPAEPTRHRHCRRSPLGRSAHSEQGSTSPAFSQRSSPSDPSISDRSILQLHACLSLSCSERALGNTPSTAPARCLRRRPPSLFAAHAMGSLRAQQPRINLLAAPPLAMAAAGQPLPETIFHRANCSPSSDGGRTAWDPKRWGREPESPCRRKTEGSCATRFDGGRRFVGSRLPEEQRKQPPRRPNSKPGDRLGTESFEAARNFPYRFPPSAFPQP